VIKMKFDFRYASAAARDESVTAEMTAALSAVRRQSPRAQPACTWRLTPDGRLACTWGPISASRPRFADEPGFSHA
jgi:hypothetical protein